MVGGTEFGQNSIEEFEFPRGSVEVQPGEWRREYTMLICKWAEKEACSNFQAGLRQPT